MWARIENNVVVELTDTDPTGRFNSSLIWVSCPTGTTLGDVYDPIAKTFSAAAGPSLQDAQASQSVIIAFDCQNAIEAGFSSSALGSAYTYGSKATDQANIDAAARSSSGASLWCQDSTGAWSFKAHTQAQAKQVQSDKDAHIQAQQTTYAGLLSQIGAITTNTPNYISAVQAIVW